jgi:hypothetical protein
MLVVKEVVLKIECVKQVSRPCLVKIRFKLSGQVRSGQFTTLNSRPWTKGQREEVVLIVVLTPDAKRTILCEVEKWA